MMMSILPVLLIFLNHSGGRTDRAEQIVFIHLVPDKKKWINPSRLCQEFKNRPRLIMQY